MGKQLLLDWKEEGSRGEGEGREEEDVVAVVAKDKYPLYIIC